MLARSRKFQKIHTHAKTTDVEAWGEFSRHGYGCGLPKIPEMSDGGSFIELFFWKKKPLMHLSMLCPRVGGGGTTG